MASRKRNREFFVGALLGAFSLGSLSAAAIGSASFRTPAERVAQFIATVGLGLPLVLALALLVSGWVLLIHGPSRLRLALVLESSKRRFRLLLVGPFLLLAWTVLSYWNLVVLTKVPLAPSLSALLGSIGSVVLLIAGSNALEAAATALSRRVARPSLSLAGTVSLVSLFGGIFVLAMQGATSGTGGIAAVFGVVRRDEINYRPLVELFVLAVGAYVGAALLPKFLRRKELSGAAALLLASMSVALFKTAQLRPSAALAIERQRGLSSIVLAVLSRLTDSDRDGESNSFGGEDCRDDAPAIHPGAVDLPDNGVDEDCSGADAHAESRSAKAIVAPAVVSNGASASANVKNVVLLTIDTLRYDLGYSGVAATPQVSPNLDKLAAESLTYERAYSLASYTSKSLSPMLIGRYPSETERTFEHFDRFSPNVPWLAERLQKAGHATVSVQGYWYFFFKGYGFERGYDVLNSNAAPKVASVEGDGSSNGGRVADEVIAELGKLKGDPRGFFLWGHWVDPHSEYVRHKEFDFGASSRQRYDSEVRFVDEQIGRVLAELEKLGIQDKTAVLVTSDHGEAFGEHGMIRHGFEVWEELVRVPLLLRVPGLAPRRVSARRSTIDVAPTILTLLRVPFDSAGDAVVRGTPLLPDATEQPAVRPVLVDMPEGPHNKERRAFYSGEYKIVVSSGKVIGVYDLAKDPGEKNDLSSDEALTSRLKAEYSEMLGTLTLRAAKR